ncbi:oligosaccharide repeat unit polymerase [Paeniglutamicibacter sulfureus]|uniref:Oligosaccharide repeat unit polymerase n=1 Tax=Paeniglutamicibacter sulfureus TaxID=43666 RepID=A0ABU2BMQ2_9MICC|nr:oligosaccharide repeat unit polymerase [Paeniglutamicibacter sulfureus]MDR7359919.1 oligosaccharide repeat unit polymerase [Paeniglutamicibacter sulfureus]
MIILLALSAMVRFIAPRTFFVALCHNGVWAGALALIATDLIHYTPASTTAWMTLITGLVFFNLGVMTAGLRSNKYVNVPSQTTTGDSSLISRRLLLLLLLVYMLAFGFYLYVVGERFGYETILEDPESIRSADGVSYLASVPLPIRLALFLGPFIFAVLGVRDALKNPLPLLVRLIGMAVLGLSMLALLQRTNLFMGVLLLLAVLLTKPKLANQSQLTRRRSGRSRRVHPALAICLLGVVLIGSFQYLGSALGKTGEQYDSTVVSPALKASGLTSPFHYYTSGTVAFLALVDSKNASWPEPNVRGEINIGDNNPQTWGAALFAPILEVFPVASAWENIAPFIDVGVLTNVFTWLEPFYRDFRVAGVSFGMMAYGFTIAYLFRRRYLSTRAFWIQAVMLSTVFLSPFVAKINNTLFIVMIMTIVFVTLHSHNSNKVQAAVRGPSSK